MVRSAQKLICACCNQAACLLKARGGTCAELPEQLVVAREARLGLTFVALGGGEVLLLRRQLLAKVGSGVSFGKRSDSSGVRRHD